ncbi:MAG: DUF4404 family protein [Oxalobacter sp.]|jgi:DNA repair exonuclease SbcCD ATPase subunit|nr:MAG: DUF4404 family protein [Oxalobacter sp.]
MNPTDLKKTLATLHAELQSTDRLDQELKSLLEILDRDIRALLDKQEAPSQASELAERIREHAARFAAQHPTIEGTLREIAETLGRMGI